MLTRWIKIILPSCLFHDGYLVTLITFEGTILDEVVSCFSEKYLPLVFQSVMFLYFKIERGNRNAKIKGNGVVAKLLFLISVYEFPLLL